MIEKRLKKLWKLTVLISARQIYLLGRNWYLLVTQPYLTVKQIKDSEDKSQIFLILLTAISPVVVYVVARVVWDLVKYQRLLMLTGKVFLGMGMVQMIIFIYLGYWILMVIRKDK